LYLAFVFREARHWLALGALVMALGWAQPEAARAGTDVCGDGVTEGLEDCDDGAANNGGTNSCCTADCMFKGTGAPCPDTTPDDCSKPGCNEGTCIQTQSTQFPGTPCTPTTERECISNVCNFLGDCGMPKPLGTPCTDTSPDDCFAAECDGMGFCEQELDQEDFGTPCVPPAPFPDCVESQCNGTNAICGFPKSPGAACTDTTPGDCFEPGCNGSGLCIQEFDQRPASAPCTPTSPLPECVAAECDAVGECGRDKPIDAPCMDTTATDCFEAACDGSGICNQTQNPEDPGTTCLDTTPDDCFTPACDGAGVCSQTARFQPAGADCPDSDPGDCLIAQCSGSGVCDQSALPRAAGEECTDTNLGDLFEARCAAGGVCDQMAVRIAAAAPTLSGNALGAASALMIAAGWFGLRRRGR
jgi:hypothetical protein